MLVVHIGMYIKIISISLRVFGTGNMIADILKNNIKYLYCVIKIFKNTSRLCCY